ncbi:MAG: hypothetical protein KC619_17710 [Myxococcales bacterium]|nr:hypothetical protein [Myxococcales bacterium]
MRAASRSLAALSALLILAATLPARACPPVDEPFALSADARGATFVSWSEAIRVDARGRVVRRVAVREPWVHAWPSADGAGVLLAEWDSPDGWYGCAPPQLRLRWLSFATRRTRVLGTFPQRAEGELAVLSQREAPDGTMQLDVESYGRTEVAFRIEVARGGRAARRVEVREDELRVEPPEPPEPGEASDAGLVIQDGERAITIETRAEPAGWRRFGEGLLALVAYARASEEHGTVSQPRLDVVRLRAPRRLSGSAGSMVRSVRSAP